MKNFKITLLAITATGLALVLQGCVPAIIAGGAGAAIGASTAGSSLSLGTQVDDSAIKSQSLNVINNIKGLRYNSNIEVIVYNYHVLLLGQVPTNAYKDQVAEKISMIPKVKIVYNHLQVGKPVGIDTYAHDSWTTTKVKADFIGKVNPFSFKVVTENGVVYLLGETTKEEGAKASDIASKVKGVKKVVEAFTYVKSKEPAKVSDKK